MKVMTYFRYLRIICAVFIFKFEEYLYLYLHSYIYIYIHIRICMYTLKNY